MENLKVSPLAQMDLFGRVPEVYIDIHEVTNKKKETSITLFMKELQKRNIPYQVKKLEIADLVLPNGYAVERKTVKDFCHSLFGSSDGRPRLFEQVEALREAYDYPFLLLEGGLAVRLDPTTKSIFVPVTRRLLRPRIWSVVEEQIKIMPQQYLGAVRSIEERGVKVLQSFNEKDGSLILLNLFLESKGLSVQEKERSRKKYPVLRQKPALKTIYDKQIFFLAGLPRISTVNAVKILKRYKTPLEALKKINQWSLEVDGIGEKTVEEVKKILTTEWKEEETKALKRS